MVGQEQCPRGRATAQLVHERFTRYKAEAIAARNERDEAHAREAKVGVCRFGFGRFSKCWPTETEIFGL